MSDKEYKICWAVKHLRRLDLVLWYTGYRNIDDMQAELSEYYGLDCDDVPSKSTIIYLTKSAEIHTI